MAAPLDMRLRRLLVIGLAVGPLLVLVLLWLGGRAFWGGRDRSPTDVGARTRTRVGARVATVLLPAQPRMCGATGDCVLDFPYRDELLLAERHTSGGRVWIPAVARNRGGSYPLVVLLHGIGGGEESEPLHRLLAPPLDLSRQFKRAVDGGAAVPVLVAAPSQTRDAQDSPSLWTSEGFELADFVNVLDVELEAVGEARVDRSAISVLGHSGAGCVVTPHEQNGLFQVARQVRALGQQGVHVRLLGLMDVCFHGYGGGHFLREALAGTTTRVAAMWVEPEAWSSTLDRDLEGFARGLGLSDPKPCDPKRFELCEGNARGWWLYKVRRHALEAEAAESRSGAGLTPHSELTRWFVQELLRRQFSRKKEG